MSAEPGGVRAITPLAAPVDAVVNVPGSKSISNRALVCAALADGESVLDNVLLADDTVAMIDCLRLLGTVVTVDGVSAIATVQGMGGGPDRSGLVLDARLSGTTARFVMPLLGLGQGRNRLDGSPPLRARPMADLIAGLRSLGVSVVDAGVPGHLPVEVQGPAGGGLLTMRGDVSSQYLSGMLLTGPYLPEGLSIEIVTEMVSRPYVSMTVGVMEAFGARVETATNTFTVHPGRYRPSHYRIEPDASAASYFLAAAAITGGRVRVEGLGRDSLQGDLRFADVLASMGASVTREAGAVVVQGGARLKGVDVDLADFSDMAQTLAVTAVFADSPTTVRGIGFIRGKETDRIAAVASELAKCGIAVDESDDGFVVHPGMPVAATIETYDDHRMAMAFSLLGLVVPGIEIADPGCVAKTFPGFWDELDALVSRP